MKVFIGENFSCDVNYDYAKIYHLLLENECELTTDVEEAEAIIFIGTCSCTKPHLERTMSYMESIIKKKNPTAKVFLTGCITRINEKLNYFNEIQQWISKNIDLVIPQYEIPFLIEKVLNEKSDSSTLCSEYAKNFGGAYVINETIDKKRGRIYIQTGCTNRCSFCKVHFQNTPLHSMEIQTVKLILDKMDEIGIEEIALIGMNVAQYGLDLYHEYKLPEIIEYVETKKNIKKIALVGLAVRDVIQGNFINCLKNSSKVSYVDLSLESGSDRLLSSDYINKGFTSGEFINLMSEMNSIYPKFLSLNIIAGFPTETKKDIKETIKVLEAVNPSEVNICRYTDSPYVPSHNLGPLSPSTVEKHAKVYKKKLIRRGFNANIYGPLVNSGGK